MSLRVGGVVLARATSARLPGKVLRDVHGRPLLDYVLSRLRRTEGLDAMVIATSRETADDPVAAWGARCGLDVHRGSLDDVLGRTLDAARLARLDAVARVNGDSPWLDPGLLGEAVRRFRAEEPDLVTNVLRRAWPHGVAAEVVRSDTLATIHADAGPDEREHVTRRLYRAPQGFHILELEPPPADTRRPDVCLAVDLERDLRRFERMVGILGPRVTEATTAEVIAAAMDVDRTSPEPA